MVAKKRPKRIPDESTEFSWLFGLSELFDAKTRLAIYITLLFAWRVALLLFVIMAWEHVSMRSCLRDITFEVTEEDLQGR